MGAGDQRPTSLEWQRLILDSDSKTVEDRFKLYADRFDNNTRDFSSCQVERYDGISRPFCMQLPIRFYRFFVMLCWLVLTWIPWTTRANSFSATGACFGNTLRSKLAIVQNHIGSLATAVREDHLRVYPVVRNRSVPAFF
jgi:hypothetical protein